MNKSYIKGKLSFAALLLCLLATVMSSCEEKFKLELPLAVTQNGLKFGAAGGSTHVLVYSTGKWTAAIKDPADESWAHLDRTNGEGNSELVFTYDINPGIQRKCVVVLTSGSEVEEIEMIQAGYLTNADVLLKKATATVPSWEGHYSIPFTTNMDLCTERLRFKVEYMIGDSLYAASKVEDKWLTDVKIYADSVTFSATPNTTGEPRVAKLQAYAYDNVARKTYTTHTMVTQDVTTGNFTFTNAEGENVESFEKECLLPWSTNMELYFDQVKVDVQYQEQGEPWLTNFVPTPDGLKVLVGESHSKTERHAAINLTCNTPAGNASATLKVTQAKPAVEVKFSDLRAMLTSAGKATLEEGFIMAQVISEPGNANLDINPLTGYKTADLTENGKTAYIQSVDGQYGLRVKFPDASEAACLPRYATVKIAVAGLEVERENNPVRYTLRGLTSGSIIETTPGTAASLPVKNRTFSQVTDDDMYTFVTFSDVEAAMRVGAWGNIHDRYTYESETVPDGQKLPTTGIDEVRNEVMPRFFLDKNGDMMPMAINAQTPWRRTGSFIPKGSGTIKAIICGTTLPQYKYNNETSGYTFRVMSLSDINLAATSKASTLIAEWQWTAGASSIKFNGSGVASGVLPTEGTGLMTTTATNTDACTALTTSFMYPAFQPRTETVVNQSLAFRYNAKWWNFTTKKGESVMWDFSTAGLSGSKVTFSMTASSGKQSAPNNGAPVDWVMEYSTDGTNFTKLKDFVLYPSPIFSYQGLDLPCGNAEYYFELPASVLGKDKVTLRMTPTGLKYTASYTTGLRGGTITSGSAADVATYLRFESIVIRYNK